MADIEIGSFTPEQVRLLWEDYQSRKQLAPQLQANFPQRKPIDEPSPHRIFVKNESGEEIPAFGCMQITGMVDEVGRALLTVTKPTNACKEYLFNSPYKIEAGGYGWGYSWGVVRMLGTSAGYESCQRYAPQSGSWAVSSGPGPFLVYGADGQIPGTVWGRIVGDHCVARWIVFDFETGEDNNRVTPTDYWDGPDPGACSNDGKVDVEYPVGEPLCDCTVVAVFDPNTGVYKALDTESSMLGEPVTQEVMTDLENDDCGVSISKLEIKLFSNSCNPTPTPTVVELGESTPVLVAMSSESCGRIDYSYQNVRVFPCGSGPEQAGFNINFDGVLFVSGASFGPPDCGGAVYKWLYSGALWQWVLQSGCDCGTHDAPTTPGTFDGQEVTMECTAPNNSLCGLNLELKSMCQDTYYTPTSTVHVPLPLQAREVVTDVVDMGVGQPVRIYYETVYVCTYDNIRTEDITTEDCEGGSSSGG
jgi:hypothetical protein